MNLDEKVLEAYERTIINEAMSTSEKAVKYFTKDKETFMKQFKKYESSFSRDFLPDIGRAFDEIISAVKGEIDHQKLGEEWKKLKDLYVI